MIDVVGFLTSEVPRWQAILSSVLCGMIMYVIGVRQS